jgi:hypothetical protein
MFLVVAGGPAEGLHPVCCVRGQRHGGGGREEGARAAVPLGRRGGGEPRALRLCEASLHAHHSHAGPPGGKLSTGHLGDFNTFLSCMVLWADSLV